jgi:hypothetical protein
MSGNNITTIVYNIDSMTDSLTLVSEGFDASTDGEYGPDGTKWGWLPDSGYANPIRDFT